MMCRYEGSHETSLQSHKAVITFGFSELKICMYHLPTQGSASPEVAARSATSGEAEPCVGRWHVYNVGLFFFFVQCGKRADDYSVHRMTTLSHSQLKEEVISFESHVHLNSMNFQERIIASIMVSCFNTKLELMSSRV